MPPMPHDFGVGGWQCHGGRNLLENNKSFWDECYCQYKQEDGMNYQDTNALTIGKWVEQGWEWGKPISHEAFVQAQQGNWSIVLTPQIQVPHAWLGEVSGKQILGLASGGGQQMPLLTAAGGICTVLDYCEQQLEQERMVAQREGYTIALVHADMTKPLPFTDNTFDIIIHPVSVCYVREVRPIFRECFRVLKKGGIYLSGQDNGICYAFDEERNLVTPLPFDPIQNPDQMALFAPEVDGIQFSHTTEELLGGQLEAGFRLTHIREDTDPDGVLASYHIPQYLLSRAVKED